MHGLSRRSWLHLMVYAAPARTNTAEIGSRYFVNFGSFLKPRPLYGLRGLWVILGSMFMGVGVAYGRNE